MDPSAAADMEAAAARDICASFERELADLTFNSKPIITSLTIIAQAAAARRSAQTVVRIVENRVHQAPPDQKLPAMYLMDSILKNLGGEYCALFGRVAARLFTVAWAAADSATRGSLLRLLGTWRSAAVFDPRTLEDVELRARYLSAGQPQPQQPARYDQRRSRPPATPQQQQQQQQQQPPPPPRSSSSRSRR
eukprot:m51a1_g9228 hypothetical protein (193) ;mRNA; r:73214-74222